MTSTSFLAPCSASQWCTTPGENGLYKDELNSDFSNCNILRLPAVFSISLTPYLASPFLPFYVFSLSGMPGLSIALEDAAHGGLSWSAVNCSFGTQYFSATYSVSKKCLSGMHPVSSWYRGSVVHQIALHGTYLHVLQALINPPCRSVSVLKFHLINLAVNRLHQLLFLSTHNNQHQYMAIHLSKKHHSGFVTHLIPSSPSTSAPCS